MPPGDFSPGIDPRHQRNLLSLPSITAPSSASEDHGRGTTTFQGENGFNESLPFFSFSQTVFRFFSRHEPPETVAPASEFSAATPAPLAEQLDPRGIRSEGRIPKRSDGPRDEHGPKLFRGPDRRLDQPEERAPPIDPHSTEPKHLGRPFRVPIGRVRGGLQRRCHRRDEKAERQAHDGGPRRVSHLFLQHMRRHPDGGHASGDRPRARPQFPGRRGLLRQHGGHRHHGRFLRKARQRVRLPAPGGAPVLLPVPGVPVGDEPDHVLFTVPGADRPVFVRVRVPVQHPVGGDLVRPAPALPEDPAARVAGSHPPQHRQHRRGVVGQVLRFRADPVDAVANDLPDRGAGGTPGGGGDVPGGRNSIVVGVVVTVQVALRPGKQRRVGPGGRHEGLGGRATKTDPVTAGRAENGPGQSRLLDGRGGTFAGASVTDQRPAPGTLFAGGGWYFW